MEIEKIIFREQFLPGNLPHWMCPMCSKGILHLAKENIIIRESANSLAAHDEDFFEYDMAWGAFTGSLECQNPTCKEVVIFSGTSLLDKIYNGENEHGVMEYTYEWAIEPKYFSLPLKLFPIDKYPEWTRPILMEAFGLLWTDASACANKLRILIEKILSKKGIPKYPKGKRTPISLQKRIDKLKNREAAHFFEAVKWMGNAGSHDTDKLKRDDILFNFEMVGEALNLLYDNHSKKLKIKAKKVIKSRGPQKKRPIKLSKFFPDF